MSWSWLAGWQTWRRCPFRTPLFELEVLFLYLTPWPCRTKGSFCPPVHAMLRLLLLSPSSQVDVRSSKSAAMRVEGLHVRKRVCCCGSVGRGRSDQEPLQEASYPALWCPSFSESPHLVNVVFCQLFFTLLSSCANCGYHYLQEEMWSSEAVSQTCYTPRARTSLAGNHLFFTSFHVQF